MLLKSQFASAPGAASPAASVESVRRRGAAAGAAVKGASLAAGPAVAARAADTRTRAMAASTPQGVRLLGSPEVSSREVQEARMEAEELRAQMREPISRI